MTLTNKTVLITGAKGGLGNHVTHAFLAAGARVIGASRSIHDSDFPNANFSAIPAEISSSAAADQLVAAAIAKWKRIDCLVHLIGAFAGGQPVSKTDDATLDQMLDVNFRAAFFLIRAVLPAMIAQRSGAILAIGSRAAGEPQAAVGAYAASKAALVSLIRTVARETAGQGVSANILLPGTMDTPVNRAAMPTADPATWVQPDQVAALLVHLASPGAAQISGAVIPIYGSES